MFSNAAILITLIYALSHCRVHAVNRGGGNLEIPSDVPEDARIVLLPKLSSSAKLTFPGEPLFDEFTTRYSDYNRPTFSLSVAVATPEDAAEAVKYAKSRNIPFLVQSGGHGLTPTTQGVQNGMQINMRLMNYTHFNLDNSIVIVGGGILTGEFTNATHARGKELTIGSCPCTGLMGIGMAAGIGRLQGMYGFFMDNVLSYKMLLHDGTITDVTPESNPDLWWAVRGAGHNFGIALEATVKVHNQTNDGMHYMMDMEFPTSRVLDVFKTLNYISTHNFPIQASFFVTSAYPGWTGVPAIRIDYVYHGTKEDAQSALQPFLDLEPIYKKEEYINWAELPWVTYGGLNNVLCNAPGGQKNVYAASAETYDLSAMLSLWTAWEKMAKKYEGKVNLLIMFQTFSQGAIRDFDSDGSAFPWRYGSKHFLLIQAAYKDLSLRTELDQWLTMQQRLMIETSGYGKLHQYVNYGHGYDDPPESLYGYEQWRMEKLLRLKEQYDPEGWFDFYQPIRRDGFRRPLDLHRIPPPGEIHLEDKQQLPVLRTEL